MENDDPLVNLLEVEQFRQKVNPQPAMDCITYLPPCKHGNIRRDQKSDAEFFVYRGEVEDRTKLYRAKNRHANAFRVRKCYQ